MLNRRHFIGTALATAASTSVSKEPVSAAESKPKTFVLVHGAWHGGWCWRYVHEQLKSQGHQVYTPTLTGLGERAHLLHKDIDLSTHVTDVINLIRFEQLENVVLVGHSYAGLVVSLVADAVTEHIQKLIFLDAVLPSQGQAFFPETQHEAILAEYGKDYVLPTGSLKFLGIPEDHKYANWVSKNLRPHPLGTLLEPVIMKNVELTGVPKYFIRCMDNLRSKNDPVLDVTKDKPEWHYTTINTGHDAMITEPKALAVLLSKLVN